MGAGKINIIVRLLWGMRRISGVENFQQLQDFVIL